MISLLHAYVSIHCEGFSLQSTYSVGPFWDIKMIFSLSSYFFKQRNKTNVLFIFWMDRQEAKEHTGAPCFSLPLPRDGKALEGVQDFPSSLSSPTRIDCSQALISVFQKPLPSGFPLNMEY